MPPAATDAAPPLIVVNPGAARLHDAARRSGVIARVALAVRARTGLEPRIEDRGLEDAQVALAASLTAPLIVVIGGDGTLRQAAAVVAGRGIPLAIVPGGTGNVLASTLGIRGVGSAEQAIRHGTPRTLDLGSARWGTTGSLEPTGEGVFLVACGIGLDARIMSAAQHEWKRRLRFGAYVGAALREITRLRASDFTIGIDGEHLEVRGYLVLIANAGDVVPGRIGPRRQIDPGDGRLDLIVVGGANPVAGARAAAELLLRKGELQGTVIRRLATSVRVEAEPAQPVETDGDPHPPGWIEARIMPGALTMLGPAR